MPCTTLASLNPLILAGLRIGLGCWRGKEREILAHGPDTLFTARLCFRARLRHGARHQGREIPFRRFLLSAEVGFVPVVTVEFVTGSLRRHRWCSEISDTKVLRRFKKISEGEVMFRKTSRAAAFFRSA